MIVFGSNLKAVQKSLNHDLGGLMDCEENNHINLFNLLKSWFRQQDDLAQLVESITLIR